MSVSDTLTPLLGRWNEGEEVQSRLMPLVYRDLRQIAGALFAKERRHHSMQPTDLVTEAYLRMLNGGPWKNRAHFFGAAARAMRHSLVDYARRRNAYKRGSTFERVAWEDAVVCEPGDLCEILAMDQALCRLEALQPRLRQIVELRYFGGLSVKEAAEVLRLSVSTVKEDWLKAKNWLKEHLDPQ